MTIIEVNLEATHHIEAKLLDDFSEVRILMAEANVTKTHIKDNTKVTIIKVITTKVIVVNIIFHHCELVLVTSDIPHRPVCGLSQLTMLLLIKYSILIGS